MKRAPRLRAATLTCLVLGLGLMLPFEVTLTRVAGIALLFAFVICGVFLIADPAFLESDED